MLGLDHKSNRQLPYLYIITNIYIQMYMSKYVYKYLPTIRYCVLYGAAYSTIRYCVTQNLGAAAHDGELRRVCRELLNELLSECTQLKLLGGSMNT